MKNITDPIMGFSDVCEIEGIESYYFRGFRHKERELQESFDSLYNGTANVLREIKPKRNLPSKERARFHIVKDSTSLPTRQQLQRIKDIMKRQGIYEEENPSDYRYCEWIALSDVRGLEKTLGTTGISVFLNKETKAIRYKEGSPFDNYVAAQKALLEYTLAYLQESPQKPENCNPMERIEYVLNGH